MIDFLYVLPAATNNGHLWSPMRFILIRSLKFLKEKIDELVKFNFIH